MVGRDTKYMVFQGFESSFAPRKICTSIHLWFNPHFLTRKPGGARKKNQVHAIYSGVFPSNMVDLSCSLCKRRNQRVSCHFKAISYCISCAFYLLICRFPIEDVGFSYSSVNLYQKASQISQSKFWDTIIYEIAISVSQTRFIS